MMRTLTTLLLTAGLAWVACNNGGGGGSASEGGIGGSGITRGVITSTANSATVAGTTYDDDNAILVFDGVEDPMGVLSVGMKVTVTGTRTGNTGVAEEIEFDDEIEGPIEAGVTVDDPIAPRRVEVTILDQTVVIEKGLTVLSGIVFADIVAGAATGDVVEVSGFRQGNGDIAATRVEFVSTDPTPAVELKGVVTGLLDGSNPGTFMIGGIGVEFDINGVNTDLDDVPGGELMEGDFVEVEGDLRMDGVTVDADNGGRIELEGPRGGDVADFEIDGLVTNFVNLGDFELDGQPVDASGFGVFFEPNDTGIVKDGARLEVEGRLESGVLIASQVNLRSGEVRVSAEIDVLDAMDETLTLLGVIEVETDAATLYESACDDFGDLMVGGFAKIRAVKIGNRVLATEIECESSAGDVEVRGRVQSFNGPGRTVTILGLLIPVDDDTGFEDFPAPGVSDPTTFFSYLASNPAVLLEVKDEDDGDPSTLDVASEIELEDD